MTLSVPSKAWFKIFWLTKKWASCFFLIAQAWNYVTKLLPLIEIQLLDVVEQHWREISVGMSILLDACLMTSYVALIIDFGECNPIYCPHSNQVHHCNEDHLGSHRNVFLFPPGGWQIRGTGRVQTGSATFEGSREPQWEEFYWLRLHVVFSKCRSWEGWRMNSLL